MHPCKIHRAGITSMARDRFGDGNTKRGAARISHSQ